MATVNKTPERLALEAEAMKIHPFWLDKLLQLFNAHADQHPNGEPARLGFGNRKVEP